MASKQTLVWSAAAAVAFWGIGGTAQAQLTVNNSGNPPFIADGTPGNSNGNTENVDFADIDLDGDWDAAFADGGDTAQDQNRIWVNRGGLQAGPIGTFLDQTSTRAPQINDDSRDIEFADIDNDGDSDVYISNTAQLLNQGNRWWVNNGFKQGGTLGFFTDETAARWVNLGVNDGSTTFSSIPPGALIGGSFIDWSCDCDFGDLDNDGDLDLVHSSYGGAFAGNTPTRLFLNDGDGHFEEFNPSGFQLTGNTIPNGVPALWAEGTQQNGTTNSNGTFADIATTTLDIDVGDYDGDFDLDILHGARIGAPRFFTNRLEENGGTLGFRDTTGFVYPNNYWSSNDNYEQEFGDLTGDGLLDIYGLNWNGFNDRTFVNDGDGTFSILQSSLPSSGADDNEGDFGDFDNDGDLDLFVANFSGTNKLYFSDLAQGGNGQLSIVQTGLGGKTSLDADFADIDNDGDLDVIVAQDNNAANDTLINSASSNPAFGPDTHAPYFGGVEAIASGSATAAPDVFRARVYDNRPYYNVWYYDTEATVSVNGFNLPAVTLHTSQGDIFRGEMPGNLLGDVTWQVRSTDEVGNTGADPAQNYTNTTGLAIGGEYGSGTGGSLGVPSIEPLSVAFPDTTLHIGAANMPGGIPYAIGLGGSALPVTIGEFNVGPPVFKVKVGLTNAQGEAVLSVPVGAGFSGASIYAQAFGVGDGPFGGLSASRGLEIVLQ